MKRSALFLLLILVSATIMQANNIAVANVSLTDQSVLSHHCNVKFDLSWDNSWRTISVPGNWDAAWVFVKYRISGGVWHHASLDTAADNHTPASGSTITPGKDFMGVFIYRASEGNGTNTWTNIKIRWKYGRDGVPDDATLEVKVFAVEMVYIPQESFYFGDGNGTSESTLSFHRYNYDNTAYDVTTSWHGFQSDPSVKNDDYAQGYGSRDLTVHGMDGIETHGDPTPQDNPDYPTGYKAFYIMKYEASQEQYLDFLNLLTRVQQVNRVATDIGIGITSVTNRYVMTNSSILDFRMGIRCDATIPASDPVTFYCDLNGNGTGNEALDGQNIACNFISWPDHAAYSDWAGLRPMTELEYEKACRGPNNAFYGELAWGTTNLHSSNYTLANPGGADEYITNPGVYTGNASYSSYLGFVGRCGIFAASSTNHTRQETGATYYGVMEMSGDVLENVVHLGNVAGRSFTGLHGNGELDATGYGNVDYWPGINGNNDPSLVNTWYGGTVGITGIAGLDWRGGHAHSGNTFLRVSDRSFSVSTTNRLQYTGFRSVRSAP